jgi:hypothetical protein
MICLFSRPLLPSKERVRARFLTCKNETGSIHSRVTSRLGIFPSRNGVVCIIESRQYIQIISSVHPTAQNLRTNEHPSIPKVTRRESLGTSIACAIPRGGTMYIISLGYP